MENTHQKERELIAAIKARDIDRAVNLLEEGADPRWPEESQFNALDYAQMSGDQGFFERISIFAKRLNVRFLMERFPSLCTHFRSLPDFSFKFTWQVHSWIPFITAFCPYDTWTVWKVGQKFRVDTTLANWANTHWTRGNTSVYFDAGSPDPLDSFVVIDHVSGERFSVLREMIDSSCLHEDCQDILKMDLIKGSIDPDTIRFEPARNFFYMRMSSEVLDEQWNSKPFSLSNANVFFTHVLSDDYGKDLMPEPNKYKKTYSGTFWCAEDYPIQPEMVIPFFEALAPFQGYARNILMLLGMFDAGMPIKGTVNVFPTVKLDYSITDFSDDVESYRNLVDLPPPAQAQNDNEHNTCEESHSEGN